MFIVSYVHVILVLGGYVKFPPKSNSTSIGVLFVFAASYKQAVYEQTGGRDYFLAHLTK